MDGPLLLACGLGGGLLQSAWLVDFHLAPGVVASSDFGDWCAAVATLAHDQEALYPAHRPMLAARALAPLAQAVGTADSLLLSAQFCAAWICASLYLWGRALHGRLAGVAAALFAGALGPLVVLGRTLSFYPQITAAFTAGAALAAWAARAGGPWALGLAGLGVAGCLLIDLRGLIWALPLLGVAALGLLQPPWRLGRGLLGVAALGLPLVGAWRAAPLAWHRDTGSLEEQADLRARFWELGLQEARYAPPYSHTTRYVWGVTPLSGIPATLAHFRAQRDLVPAPERLEPLAGPPRRRQVDPWRALVAGSAVAGAWALRRRPSRLLGLVGTGLPFVVALQGAVTFQSSAVRFLGQAAPVVALVLGLGWAALAQGGPPAGESAAWGRRAWAWWLGAVGLALALTLGLLPSMLSPAAAWRPGPDARPDGYRAVRCYVGTAAGEAGACLGGEAPRDPRCTQALARELAEGLNLRTRALPAEQAP